MEYGSSSCLGVDPECVGDTHRGAPGGNGELVTHAKARRCILPLPDVPSYTRLAQRREGCLAYRRSLDPQRIDKHKSGDNEEPRRIAPHLFYLPLFTRVRPPRRATPVPVSDHCA